MMTWGLAALAGTVLTVLLYRRTDLVGAPLLVLLRWSAATAVVAALLDAPVRRAVPPAVVVALDVSASWTAAEDPDRWRAARALADSLTQGRAGELRLFGDSLRTAPIPEAPSDLTSRIRPVVEWALATGRPVHVITDGRLDDPEWVTRLPVGSVVHRLESPPRAAAHLTALEAPTLAITGDTISAQVTITADALGAPAQTLTLALEGRAAQRLALEAMAPYEPRIIPVPVALPPVNGLVTLTARLRDGTAAVDSLAVSIEITASAAAVAVSTAPDQDARFAVAALRAVRRGPVRAYWQVAKGIWREDGTLTPVEEATVRREAREARLLFLHGDTTLLGAPDALRNAGLLLMSPPPAGEEYYPTAPGRSPLAEALSGVPWDSLPPLDVAPATARAGEAEGTVVETRRARRGESRAAIRLADRTTIGQRVVRIPAAGFWRWKSRGGRSAESYDALFGALIDWAGATEGGASDSTARRASASRAREIARRAELRPRAPTVSSGPVGSGVVQGRPIGARGTWWLAALALAALSMEWVLRRRRGLR
ncbi:MAG: hypothetical protein RL625_1137 [Gemmatimonadota bacterium]